MRSKDNLHISITGATGFLGRYIVRHLAEAGHRLRCWHRPESDRSGLEDLAKSIEWAVGDLSDPQAPAALIHGADAIVHSALQWPRSGGFRSAGQDDLLGFLEA